MSLTALAMLATPGPAQAAFDPQDAWSVWKAMEPAATARCESRGCYPRDGGLAMYNRHPNSFHGVLPAWFRDDIQLFYAFLDCKTDMRGCKTLEIFGSFSDAQPAAAVVARAKAANPTCDYRVDSVPFAGDYREVVVRVSLAPTTKLADIAAAKRLVERCTRAIAG